jgi:hypothetical protein
MPLQATSGAASYDAFGGGVPVVPAYIEEVFSTYLYTGNGSTQTITNGIDLSTKGGLVWTKPRSIADVHALFDTLRGVNNAIQTQSTTVQATLPNSLTAFNSSGFSLGSDGAGIVNASGQTYASWTFRKQPKFFDIVTYTGTGSNTTIAHSLGSVPGSIFVKRTDTTADWAVYHRSLANTQYIVLNSTAAAATGATWWNSTTPTSAVFSVGTDASVNASGGTYVAYLFAHDAGGFGLTGTDNVISCGSFTPSGGEATVNLGYEPQWILWKNADGAYGWFLLDNMRGIATGGDDQRLVANSSNAEGAAEVCSLTSTGFKAIGQVSGHNYIYIAIRRGPMKVPTDATKVFAPVQYTTATTPPTITTGFPVDMLIDTIKGPANESRALTDRLRGTTINFYNALITNDTSAESATTSTNLGYDLASNTSTRNGLFGTAYGAGYNCITWNFRRAPSFFDEVCYTGTGVAKTVAHNLGVQPELYITKNRGLVRNWQVGSTLIPNTNYLALNTTDASADGGSFSRWNDTYPTSSVFSVGNAGTNESGSTYVAYLFATCAGVSKVGSYTGTGATQTIACGFAAGARFVLIKRTDSTGDWWVWDSARGIVAGNDPYLLLNSTAAEVTNTDYIDTYSAGFEISSTAPAAINASGGTFIFLAIA